MSGGVPIRIRRTLTDTPVTPVVPLVGQPFLHSGENKFGVFDGTNMLWYPQVDPVANRLIMNKNQSISGRDSNGDANVEISFDTPNALEIIHVPSSTVLARFDTTGASFNNLIANTPIPGGTLNRFIHPGFIPQLFSSTAKTLSASGGSWLGANTYLWRKGVSSGTMSVSRAYTPGAGSITHEASETFCLKAEVTSNCSGQGIRMWVLDPYLGYTNDNTKNSNKFFISVYGPAGKTSLIRLGRAGLYTTVTVTGTGSWQRIGVTIPQHSQTTSYIMGGSNEPWAVDVLVDAEVGNWFIQEPTVQCIDQLTDEIYQYRTLSDRLAAATVCWYAPAGFNVTATNPLYVNLPVPLPILNDPYFTYDVVTVSSTHTPTIANKSERGFTVATSTMNTDFWAFVPVVAVRGPLTDIA